MRLGRTRPIIRRRRPLYGVTNPVFQNTRNRELGYRAPVLAFGIGRPAEGAMVRDLRTIAAVVFAFGMIAWVLVAECPQKSPVWMEASQSLSADPDLRSISERSEFMRTER